MRRLMTFFVVLAVLVTAGPISAEGSPGYYNVIHNNELPFMAASSREIKNIVGFWQSNKDELTLAELVTARAHEICQNIGEGVPLDFTLATEGSSETMRFFKDHTLIQVTDDDLASWGAIVLDAGLFLITGGLSTILRAGAVTIIRTMSFELAANYAFNVALAQFEAIDVKGMWNYRHVKFTTIKCISKADVGTPREDLTRKNYFCPKADGFNEPYCRSIPTFGEFQCLNSAYSEGYDIGRSRESCKILGPKPYPQMAAHVIKYCSNASNYMECLEKAGGVHEAVLNECWRYPSYEYGLKCIELTRTRAPHEVETCNAFGNYNNLKKCIESLPKTLIEPHVVEACSAYSYMESRIKCLNFLSGYSPGAVDLCKDMQSEVKSDLTVWEECVKGLPEKNIETHVAEICDEQTTFMSAMHECVKARHGYTAAKIELCRPYENYVTSYWEVQSKCLSQLPEAPIDSKVVEFCQDYRYMDAMITCAKAAAGKTEDQLDECSGYNASYLEECFAKK